MSSELETAGAASLGGLGAGGQADLAGQPCRNCGEQVEARYCPRCGQLASSFHRPVFSLFAETVSDSFALDGRLARTLPLLMFRPGVLSRQYSQGKRARYVPPFRLFLLSSLLFYFVAFAFVGQGRWMDNIEAGKADAIQGQAAIEAGEGTSGIAGSGEVGSLPGLPLTEQADTPSEVGRRVIDNPKLFVAALQTWAQRVSLLLVPLSILALSLVYFWRRKLYIYDHAIHALHLHSWMYLAGAVALMASLAIGELAGLLFYMALPVYVFFSLRGAYQTGVFGGLVRTVFLLLFWLISLSFLLVLVLVASALSM